MITNYFNLSHGNKTKKENNVTKYEYFELHRSFFPNNLFKTLYNEVKPYLAQNASRQSCVCISETYKDIFSIYELPKLDWTHTVEDIKNKILLNEKDCRIDYGLVHYYPDETSIINWHSDKEALNSSIYSVSIGGTRKFSIRDKNTKEVISFELEDGDLFIMKPGCQERYEHCIKSIKKFNIPRLNITFRQVEGYLYYFIYDVDNLRVFTTNTPPSNCVIISVSNQRISIGIIKSSKNYDNYLSQEQDSKFKNEKEANISLLKSNLQKAIRRYEKDIALNTTMKMIENDLIIILLRRLSIISFEDVKINKYYPIILWYYVASNCKSYKFTTFDIFFIYSYVGLLCDIKEYLPQTYSNTLNYDLNELFKNEYCLALYIRMQYGGFRGEINMINSIINKLMLGEIQICDMELKIYSEIEIDEVKILDSAIDFHPFPKMLEKVLQRIINDDNIEMTYKLTEKNIKYYIWNFDSNVNYRNIIEYKKEELFNWNNIIKPKCDNYRKYIKQLIRNDFK